MKKGDLVIWKSSAYYGDFRPDELAIVVIGIGKKVQIMAVHDLEERWVGREYVRPIEQLAWMVDYIVREGFGRTHMDALVKIIGLVNDCEESEREVLEFAHGLYEKYAR